MTLSLKLLFLVFMFPFLFLAQLPINAEDPKNVVVNDSDDDIHFNFNNFNTGI